VRFLLLLCPVVGDAGANQLHRKLRRSRWERQCADSPSFERSRSCIHCINLIRFHGRKNLQSPNTGTAPKNMFAGAKFRLRQQSTYRGGVSAFWPINLRAGTNRPASCCCGKRVRIDSQRATDFVQACQTTQGKNPQSRLRKARERHSGSSTPCFSRVVNQYKRFPLFRRF
jgi:hypothetical protein